MQHICNTIYRLNYKIQRKLIREFNVMEILKIKDILKELKTKSRIERRYLSMLDVRLAFT